MALNVTTAVIGSGCNTATASPSLAQWDQGQVLKIEGVDLPSAYQVEFSTEYTRNAIPKIGNANGVAIPNELLQRSAPITAYLVLHEGLNDREREYWITIYITPGTPPETITPDPEEQSVIDETIAALQDGVAAAEAAAQSVQNMGVEAETLASGSEASVEKTVDPETGAVTLTFGIPRGNQGNPGVTPDFRIGTVETLPATSPATATITGTAAEPVLNLGIPQGQKGDPGGSSGTTDYRDLENKPQINGHTLSGDQSASDLGLGTYSKPGTGIPKTDLASDVQQSLGKADSALQSAPVSSVAGKTGAVQLNAGDIEFADSETYAAGSIGAEVSQQKNAIRVIDQIARDMIYTVPHSDIIQGTYNTNGSVSPSSTRIRVNKPLLLRKNDVLLFTGGEKASNIFLGLSSNGTTFTDDKWEYKKYIWYFTEDKYVIPVFKNDSGSSISPSDYDATLQIISLVNREMDKNLTVTDLFVLQNVNLFNKNDPNLVQGAYINTSPLAKIEKSASACVTGFIPVQPGKNYKLHIYSSTSSAYVTLYDANHQPYDYIARAKLQDANNHYYINMAIGENSLARFVRYNVPVDGLDYCMFVESAASEDMPSYIAYNNSVYPLPQNIKITNRYEITMEGGGFESTEEPTVSINDYNNYNRTAFYVDIKNASALSVDIDELTISSLTMRYYDSSMTLISKISVSSDFGREFAVLNQTKYIRFSMACTEKINAITIAVTGNEESIEEIPRTQKGSPADKCTYHVYGDVITTSRLLLPSIYTAKGTPVPLVLWMDGSGNFTKWNDGFSQSKLPYLQYLADEGFAVFSVFAWGNEYLTKYSSCGNSYPYPIPINLECIKKGIEYVCSRYNIDKDNIHIMSKSQGGQVALYYASKPDFNIRSIGMFAPVLDYLSMPGSSNYADTRKAIADELEMVGDTQYFGSTSFDAYSNDAKTFWLTNLEKINGMNEAWTLLNGQTLAEKYADAIDSGERYWADKTVTDIYQNYDLSKMAFIPVKIWGAADDNETPYMKMVEAIKQLSNGGTEAYLRTFPNNTGKHNCADLGTNVEASITAANGTVYTNLPSGWYENVLWMRSKMPIR